MPLTVRTLLVALITAGLALLWQSTTVRFNYRGDWTALFCVGANTPSPPGLPATWIFAGSNGYDGQFYRVVAHDPWIQTDAWRYIDSARRRYQRIFLPALAWLVAGGRDSGIDAAYIGVLLFFVFVGSWYSALWNATEGRSVWWGLVVLVLPGTLASLDRMTVDPALYACIAAALYYWNRRCWAACWVAAAAAFLTRDLGLLLAGAMVFTAACEKSWRRAAALGTASFPGLLWYIYLARIATDRTTMIPRWLFRHPLEGIALSLFHVAAHTPVGLMRYASIRITTQALDTCVVAGTFIAAGFALASLRRWPPALQAAICAGYAAVLIAASIPEFWQDTYSPARAFTPLVALVAWSAKEERNMWRVLPLAILSGRIIWQLGPQVLGILRAAG